MDPKYTIILDYSDGSFDTRTEPERLAEQGFDNPFEAVGHILLNGDEDYMETWDLKITDAAIDHLSQHDANGLEMMVDARNSPTERLAPQVETLRVAKDLLQ